MKPSFSSRGIGVHCLNTIKEALNRGSRMQAKVIQKYIENPCLLNIPVKKGKSDKRKFDLRQWVLVTSFRPLTIYIFNSCYAKICGSEFSLEDIKDKYKHISNFSIQKNNRNVNDVNQELVMNIPQLLANLKSTFHM